MFIIVKYRDIFQVRMKWIPLDLFMVFYSNPLFSILFLVFKFQRDFSSHSATRKRKISLFKKNILLILFSSRMFSFLVTFLLFSSTFFCHLLLHSKHFLSTYFKNNFYRNFSPQIQHKFNCFASHFFSTDNLCYI